MNWPCLLSHRFCYLSSKTWYWPGQPSSILVSFYSVCSLMIIMPKCLASITVYAMVPPAYLFSLKSQPMYAYLIFLPNCPTDIWKLPSVDLNHLPHSHLLILFYINLSNLYNHPSRGQVGTTRFILGFSLACIQYVTKFWKFHFLFNIFPLIYLLLSILKYSLVSTWRTAFIF